MRYLLLISAIALLMLSTGCATAVRGDSQEIKFDTDPEGATVTIDGKEKLTTPAEAKLKRKDVHTVVISKPGFESIAFDMSAQWDGMALGNVIMPGGSIGTATDRVSGSDLAFYTVPKIKLQPASGNPTTQPVKMYQFKGGVLLSQKEYDAAVAEEKRAAFLHRE
jgi:hypothetical protein